jgi:hypothetical protein
LNGCIASISDGPRLEGTGLQTMLAAPNFHAARGFMHWASGCSKVIGLLASQTINGVQRLHGRLHHLKARLPFEVRLEGAVFSHEDKTTPCDRGWFFALGRTLRVPRDSRHRLFL